MPSLRPRPKRCTVPRPPFFYCIVTFAGLACNSFLRYDYSIMEYKKVQGGERMDIEWVKAFAAVAETGSFSDAADRLFLAQSVVSKRIQRLESRLGVRLLDRSHRRTALTAAGQRVLPQAQALLRQYRMLEQAARPEGGLRLALLPVADSYGFLQLLSAFSAAHPGFQLTAEERESAALPALLEDGQFDGAFYRVTGPALPREAVVLCQDEMALLAPEQEGLSPAGRVPLARFCSEPFLLLSAGTGLLEPSIELCRQAGFLPHIRYTGASAANIARMVRSGAGVALLARQVAQGCAANGLQALPLIPTFCSQLIFAPSRAGLQNPAMPALLAFLRRAAGADGPSGGPARKAAALCLAAKPESMV